MAFQKLFHQKMLQIAFLWLFLGVNPALSQNTITWNNSLVVRQASHFITAPRVKILGDGTVVCIWGESSNPNKIWCSRLENGQFTAPVSVVTTPPGPALFGFGGFEVAVHGQSVFVVFERSGSGIFLARSDDGGLTFFQPVDVQGAIAGGFTTLANIAIDESGNIFVNYIQSKNGIATQQMRRSTDGGQSFSADVEVSLPAPGKEVCECCIGSPVASSGSVWLAFRNNNENIRDHWVVRSTNLADTFDLATDVDYSDWLINACPISGPRMALAGDSLLVVWKTGTGGGSKVFASSLHGSTMFPGQQIRLGDPAQLSENQNLPDIVATNDTLGIVFQENNRIAFTFSTNGLAGLNENYTFFEKIEQELYVPTLAFHSGIFHLVYANSDSREVIYWHGAITPTVSVSEAEKLISTVSVFPNPSTNGFFGLKSESSDLVWSAVFDVFGRCLFSSNLHGRLSNIDLTVLPSGIYHIKIKTEQGEVFQKLIVDF
jgi:hypothetical protein